MRYIQQILLAAVSLSGVAMAQTDLYAGAVPFSTQEHGVDLATGNVSFSMPVRKKAGKLPFSMSLRGNFGVYLSGAQWQPTTYQFGLTALPTQAAWLVAGNGACPHGEYWDLYLIDSTGAAHAVPGDISCSVGENFVLPTSDGSGLTVVGTSAGLAIYDKSGNTSPLFFVHYPSPGPWTLTDPDGATISLNNPIGNDVPTGQYTDSLGQLALTAADSSGISGDYTYAYTDANGTNRQYGVQAGAYNVATAFGCTGKAEYSNSTPFALANSISTPTGETYTLAYEQTPGLGNGNATGRIAKIVYPSGGSISYSYSGGNNGINCNSGVVPTLTVTVNDNNGHIGAWTYTNSNNSSTAGNYTVTVKDPSSNYTVYSFAGEYQTQKQVYQGTVAPSNLLSTTVTCYNGNFTTCATPAEVPVLPFTQIDQYTYPGTSTSPSLQETKFDTYGNVIEVKKYDFGAAFPPSGNPVFDTTISYNGENGATCGTLSNAYMHDRPCTVRSINASGTTVGQTEFTYNATGHAIETQRLVSGATYLTSYASYNSNGTIATSTDVNGAITSYFYNGAGGCNDLLLTSTTLPVAGLSTSQAWNCNGGVLTSISDANGQPTTYGYVNQSGTADPLWRELSVTDPLNNEAWNTYTPASPTTFETKETALNFNGGFSAADILATGDGLGRQIFSQRRQGPASNTSTFDSIQSSYSWNATGVFTTQSMPYSGAAGASAPGGTAVTTTQSDALGRSLTVTDAGGGTTSYSYSLNDVIVTVSPAPTGENTKRRQLEYDGLGRLTSVCEITSASGSGSCGQSNSATGFLTKYTYTYNSAGDLLFTVTQNAQPGAIGGSQTRTYTYDGLPRLIAETNPEWGPGTVNYTYDSDATGTCAGSYSGDLVKRVDNGGNVTCYTYDGLHRKTGAIYPSGPNSSVTPAKTFVYDTTTFSCTSTNLKGRLSEAFTGPSSAKITDIAYCYSARGETTDEFESTPNSKGYYHTTASYWANGALNVLSGVPSRNAWTFGVDGEGRPNTAVDGTTTSLVTATAYNTASQPTGVTLGSGDSDAYTYDPNTGRMTMYQYNIGSTPKLVTGTLGWNPNWSLGSLIIADAFDSANAQTCAYSHDDLARIQSVSCGPSNPPNGATWNQSFTYDAFGNVTKSGTITFAASYLLTNGTTNNQEQSVSSCVPTYDTNGNLTRDCTFSPSNTYAWDSDANTVGVNLSSSAPISITYDAFDRAVEENNSGTYHQILYSPVGKLALMAKQIANSVFVPLPGGEQATYTNSTIRFRHYDWLGSARFESNMAEAEYGDVAYAPFGEPYSIKNTPYLSFTGQQQDTTTGLYDFLYREYNPTQGRWISPDRSGLSAVDPSNPQSWNRYAYVTNNPLTLTDVQGLWYRPLSRGGGCGLGADWWDCSNFGGYQYDTFSFLDVPVVEYGWVTDTSGVSMSQQISGATLPGAAVTNTNISLAAYWGEIVVGYALWDRFTGIPFWAFPALTADQAFSVKYDHTPIIHPDQMDALCTLAAQLGNNGYVNNGDVSDEFHAPNPGNALFEPQGQQVWSNTNKVLPTGSEPPQLLNPSGIEPGEGANGSATLVGYAVAVGGAKNTCMGLYANDVAAGNVIP